MTRERDARVPRGTTSTLAPVLALALTLMLALTGCATLPTSGPVRAGERQGSNVGARDAFVRVNPPGPRPGAGPEEVVRGFLLAAADFENGHDKARQFLDPASATRWRPDAGVVVLATPYAVTGAARPRTEGEPRAGGQAVVRLTGRSTASIDSAGRYTPAAAEQPVATPFTLRRNEQGEWRIADLRDGLYLPRHEVDRVYRPRYLYFLTPALDRVVPDPVLVPVAHNAATALVQGLVQGPGDEAGAALRTAFPAGTQPPATVSVNDGTAQVEFSSDLLRGAGADTRRQLSAQLVHTLRQLREEVQTVRITVGGSPLDVPGAPALQPASSWADFDPALPGDTRPYLALDRRVGRLDPDRFAPLPGPFGSARPPLRTPAVAPSLDRLAAVSLDGRRLFTGSVGGVEPLAPRLTGTNLAEPSYDETGALWVLDRGNNAITVVPATGDPVRVQLPPLPGRIKALRVSRDGTRLALGLGVAGAVDQLRVGFVERVGDQVRVTAVRRLAPQLSLITDLAWAGAESVAVLAQERSAVPQAYLVSFDGFAVEDRGAVPNQAVTLTAARSLNLFVGTANGQLFEAVGRQWLGRGRGQDPAYPG